MPPGDEKICSRGKIEVKEGDMGTGDLLMNLEGSGVEVQQRIEIRIAFERENGKRIEDEEIVGEGREKAFDEWRRDNRHLWGTRVCRAA